MKLFRFILVIALLYWGMQATGQSRKTTANPPEKGATINQSDNKGSRYGMWVINEPEKMGEPGFMSFGKYDNNEKYGAWYKLDEDGDLLAIETYKNNVLDGEVKYFEKGRLICIGHYRGLNPDHAFDTIIVTDPNTGAQVLRSVPTEKGSLRNGAWQFYNPENGRLTRQEDYQVDELIASKEFGMTKEDSVYYRKREANMPHNKKQKKSIFSTKYKSATGD